MSGRMGGCGTRLYITRRVNRKERRARVQREYVRGTWPSRRRTRCIRGVSTLRGQLGGQLGLKLRQWLDGTYPLPATCDRGGLALTERQRDGEAKRIDRQQRHA